MLNDHGILWDFVVTVLYKFKQPLSWCSVIFEGYARPSYYVKRKTACVRPFYPTSCKRDNKQQYYCKYGRYSFI